MPARASGALTMFSTVWCGYCTRLKRQLDRAGVPYVDVDIEQDDEAAAFVESATGGTRTVPTVLLPDGRTLTNPTLSELSEQLAQTA